MAVAFREKCRCDDYSTIHRLLRNVDCDCNRRDSFDELHIVVVVVVAHSDDAALHSPTS